MPVPAGFTITTEVCIDYYNNGRKWPEGLEEQIKENIAKVEKAMGAVFGSRRIRCFLSVRSGARVSMPGMMDTILNLGLNDRAVEGLIKRSNNPRFAYDSYRRFVQMYGDVVFGVEHSQVRAVDRRDEAEEGRHARHRARRRATGRGLVARFKALVEKETGKKFPEDPWEQLKGAINAVFNSWNNPQGRDPVPEDQRHPWRLGHGGQRPEHGLRQPGRDVRHRRRLYPRPVYGEKVYYGEYLINAQGEDVVAGIRTPEPISTLEAQMPEVYKRAYRALRTPREALHATCRTWSSPSKREALHAADP